MKEEVLAYPCGRLKMEVNLSQSTDTVTARLQSNVKLRSTNKELPGVLSTLPTELRTRNKRAKAVWAAVQYPAR